MRLLIKPFKPPRPAFLRHISADPQPTTPPPDFSSPISQTLSLIRTTDPSSWPTHSDLNTLLSSLSPLSVLKITRQLPDYQNALRFFNHLKSDNPNLSDAVPLAFQAVLELALRENPRSPEKLHELFVLSKDQNIPLSVNAGTLLIKCFGRANMLDEMVVVFDSMDEEMKNTDVLNLVIAGLLNWGRVNDALKLLDEMFKPDTSYPPNSNTAGIIFSNILKKNRCGWSVTNEEIYNLVLSFGKSGVTLDRVLLTQVITSFCTDGDCDKAGNVLPEGLIMNSDSDVDVAFYNALLTALGQNKDFSRMNSLMKEMMENGIKPNVVTYGIMIKHLCRYRRMNEALEVFDKMTNGELGVNPNDVMYNTVIDGLCKVGRHEDGFKLMERMRLERKCEPNTITYNFLIDAFCKSGDIEKGRELFERMSKEGTNPNVITLNSLLDGMCKHGMVSTAMEFFNDMRKKGLKGNVFTYTNLITAFCNVNNIDRARKMFNEMCENGCSPDAVVNAGNLVIAGLLNCGRVNDALKLLDEMFKPDTRYPPNSNTAGIVFSKILKKNQCGSSVTNEEIYNLVLSFGKSDVILDRVLLTQVIMRFCRDGDCDKAWNVLHEGVNSDADVDVASCNALLTALGQNRDFSRMNSVMKEMMEKGIKPNVVTYGIMIKHLCRYRRMDEALEVFDKMRDGELGVDPDVVIYNTVIGALCKLERHEEGFKLMERMRLERKCEPNTITYNCLIDGFCKSNDIEKGRELFERMSKEGMNPNVITLNSLLDGMCKHGMVSTAMEFLNDMRKKGLKGNAFTYTNLITAFCKVNNIDRAMKMFDEMCENGCSADAVVYCSLISGLSQAGRMDDAASILLKMKEAGFCLDVVGYNILIVGFCRKNKLDKASEILKDMENFGLKPDRVTYNTLISFFCGNDDFSHAHRVLKKMIDDGLTPTVHTYGALIHAYCSKGNIGAGMKIFRDLGLSSKVPPNTVIYNILIDALCTKGDIEGGLSLMEDMKVKGVRPNSNTYNALFKGLQRRNWFKKALKYMDQMTEDGCEPDYVTMGILTEWLPVVGEIEKLRRFARGSQVSGT